MFPRIAVDPQGTITAVWSGLVGSNRAVRSRVFDPVVLEIDDLEAPATGVVGQPVSMSANPVDVWSAVESSWDFGDGGTGAGASVDHRYSTPGERTVTVTGSTDGAANETSTSGTIVIEPNPDIAAGIDPCDFEPPDLPHAHGHRSPVTGPGVARRGFSVSLSRV